MKTRLQLAFICILAFSGLKLSANPVPPPPQTMINELFFDENGDWQIELNRNHLYDSEYAFEIFTTNGKAKIINFPQETKDGFRVISQANLDKPLTINIEGDSIHIEVYYNNGEFVKYLSNHSYISFGNHPSATVGSPKTGQSIVLTGYEGWLVPYSLSNNPTIGTYNDINEIYATIRGTLYSEGEIPIANKNFSLRTDVLINDEFHYSEEWALELSKDFLRTNDQGEFSIDVFASKYTKDLYIYRNESGDEYRGYIKEIDLNLQPKDTVECDFHVVKSDFNSLEEAEYNENLIKVYPNPIGKDKALNYEIDLPVNALDIIAEIYSLSGSLLLSQKIEDNAGTINVSSLAKGNYILKFRGEKGDQFSTKILIE